MIYNISIFGDIDFSAYGSWQPLSILGVPQVKNMGTFYGDSRHNFELLYQILACYLFFPSWDTSFTPTTGLFIIDLFFPIAAF